MTFFEIAAPLAARGFKVIRLLPKSKVAADSSWPELATTNEQTIQEWSEKTPDYNCAVVADHRVGGLLFVEVDSAEFIARYKQETGRSLPNTFRVRSSPGRGHLYFLNTAYSLENLPNISQGVVEGKDFSVRVKNAYCVAPGSIHPKSGTPYELLYSGPVLDIPNDFVDWLLSQREVKQEITASLEGEMIPRGAHDVTLTSIAGKMRAIGMSAKSIETALIEICEERCVDYGSDYKQMIEKISQSIGNKPFKDTTVIINGAPAGTVLDRAPVVPTTAIVAAPLAIETIPYPKFPNWVWEGCSLYDGFAKPIVDCNSRYTEFMMMPAMTLFMNYLGTKVRLKHNPMLIPSLFLVMIGKRGQVIKSSSVDDAINYLATAGLVDHSTSAKNNAEGKTIVFSAGSPEGLGTEMSRINCRNACLFYDELSLLTSKASIDSSALTPQLLTLYESGKFQNLIKGRKESFGFDPGSYCASMICCSTEKVFQKNWSKLNGRSSGLDDRTFFLYQPETFKDVVPRVHINTTDGSVLTRKRIEAALAKGVYEFSRLEGPLQRISKKYNNRPEIRAEKFAWYFAIDRGLEEIDDDCVERAVELVEYEQAVKRYTETYEADTKESGIQQALIQFLKKNSGTATIADVNKALHPERYGTSMWGFAYAGMIKAGWIREEGDPKRVVLLWAPDTSED